MSDVDFEDVPAETPLSPEEAILRRHKREKKELQGKIVAMKKTISKTDKKKKKDLADEVAKLETELEERHKLELSAFRPQQQKINPNQDAAPAPEVPALVKPANEVVAETAREDSTPPSPGGNRLSKAAKRREKKAASEKERQQRIEHETAELQEGADWKIEDQKLVKILEGLNLGIHDIPSDGHCLYRALSHQLNRLNETMSIEDLRERTAKFLAANKDDYVHYLDESETNGANSFESYCNKIATTAAWGGDIEIRAISQILKRPIKVIQAEGPVLLFGEEFGTEKDVLTLTYHRHKFKLGAHYNSAVPAAEADANENRESDSGP